MSGEDLRPWYQEDEGRWLLFTRRGIDIDQYPGAKAYLEQFRTRLEPRPANWPERKPWLGRKPGAYQWYEIQDTVEYYPAFDRPKIFWPDICKLPRFSYDETGRYINNTGFVVAVDDLALLAILQSRVTWFALSQIATPLRLRAGLWQYRMFPQFVERLPIPALPDADRDPLAALARRITDDARARYARHEKARRLLRTQFGGGADTAAPLNQKLTAYWNLPDGRALQAEIEKHYKGARIPVAERGEWDDWLTAEKAAHRAATDRIIAAESELNERVYDLFGLTADEARRIEESTKYAYGEV